MNHNLHRKLFKSHKSTVIYTFQIINQNVPVMTDEAPGVTVSIPVSLFLRPL